MRNDVKLKFENKYALIVKCLGMTADEKNAASQLANKRWKGMTAEERSEATRAMWEKRWKGHVAKRPASSRNTGRPKGRPKKTAAKKKGGK